MRKNVRKGELDFAGEAFRSDRVYYADSAWWVATREEDRGPFPSKALAKLDAQNYPRRIQQAGSPR